jgi:hypothetical protein
VVPEAHDDDHRGAVGDPEGFVRLPWLRGVAHQARRKHTPARIHHRRHRAALAKPSGLPPSDVPFCRFTGNNGILAEDVQGLTISEFVSEASRASPYW